MQTMIAPGVASGTCPDCVGTLLMADDGSVSGVPGALIPCSCAPEHPGSQSWTPSMWDQYRAQMDATARQWVAVYGLPTRTAWPVDNAVETNSATSGTTSSRGAAA